MANCPLVEGRIAYNRAMLLPPLLTAATVGFSAGVTPGPLQAIFLSYAIKGGWKKALPAAIAPVISDGPVILIVLLLLNNVSDTLVRLLQIARAPRWPASPSTSSCRAWA